MAKAAKTVEQHKGVMILAAGIGKRMKSSLPKVLHELGGRPMIFHILYRILETFPKASVAIVVGHNRELVEAAIRGNPELSQLKLSFIHQDVQGGTGHAARCAMESPWGEEIIHKKSTVLVLPGDLPLIPNELVDQMMAVLEKEEVMRLLTCELRDPTGYGRVVRRGKQGPVLRIVEERDANIREKAIAEVGASIYSFQASFLKYGLQHISNKNAQGEYYLTDLIAQASRAKKKIDVLNWRNQDDLRGVNDSWELAQAGRILNERCVKKWALAGVKFMDPWTTTVDITVKLEHDAMIYPRAMLLGSTRIATRASVGAGAVLKNVDVGAEAVVKTGTVAESSRIEARAQVGPYAHLRPDSTVGQGAKIGNFVELKKTRIGEGSSVAHLSYLGDAEVGKGVNIGCGFITCNFDGRIIQGERKHKTVIEDHVFIGSDCQTVAPIKIGSGAYIASGSTVTENVESDDLVIARSRQVVKHGYAKKLR